MERIGIRELRQHATRYISRVKQGAVIEVTDRGHPVARLVPLDTDDSLRATMIGRGEIIAASSRRRRFDPETLPAGELTEILDDLRADR